MPSTRRSLLRTIGGTALTMTAAGTAAAHGDEDHSPTIEPQQRQELAEVRQATAKYQDPETAEQDGYMPVHGCVPNPDGEGAMGVHFANPALRGDGTVTPTEPEVLLYEPTETGYNLVGVEYIANADAVDSRPELFGQPFSGPMPAHGEHGAEHYELHVWCWKSNPNGMFAPFNPNVDC